MELVNLLFIGSVFLYIAYSAGSRLGGAGSAVYKHNMGCTGWIILGLLTLGVVAAFS